MIILLYIFGILFIIMAYQQKAIYNTIGCLICGIALIVFANNYPIIF